MADENKGGGGFLSGFIIGGVIGVAIGLLLAPRKGEETWSQLVESGQSLRSKMEGLTSIARGSMDEVAALAHEGASEVASRARESTEALAAKAMSRIDEAIEEGKRAASESVVELEGKLREHRGKTSRPKAETN